MASRRKKKHNGKNPAQRAAQLKKEAQQRAFLKAFGRCGNIFRACEKSRVGRRTHYDWLESDERYTAIFRDLKEQWVEVLEAEADRRGKDGVSKPVFYQGKVCGHIREFSDVLLIVRLKALAPERYRENVNLSGNVGLPVEDFYNRIAERQREEKKP